MLEIYEAMLLLRCGPKHEIAAMLKRCTNFIFDKDGFLRNLHNLGAQPTPFAIRKHGTLFREAHYFQFDFNIPKQQMTTLQNDFKKDTDVVNYVLFKKIADEIDYDQCTFDDEMKPVPYRPQVEHLVKAANRINYKRTKRSRSFFSKLKHYPLVR